MTDETLGPLPPATGKMLTYTAEAMEAERQRCYALGAAAERERCAKLCEGLAPELLRWWGPGQATAACQDCAAAIRANT